MGGLRKCVEVLWKCVVLFWKCGVLCGIIASFCESVGSSVEVWSVGVPLWRSYGSASSAPSPYYDRRRESTAGGGREHVRTTAMLVAVVLCFVVVELPQGLLAFLSGIDRRIFDDVYVPLGDVWDAAVIVNSAVNFILYCTMKSPVNFWVYGPGGIFPVLPEPKPKLELMKSGARLEGSTSGCTA